MRSQHDANLAFVRCSDNTTGQGYNTGSDNYGSGSAAGQGGNTGSYGTGYDNTRQIYTDDRNPSGYGQGSGTTYTDAGTHGGAGSYGGTGHDSSYSGTNVGSNTGGQYSGGHSGSGSGNTSSNTKGQEYDATGGQVDDRTFGQKAKDAFKPGSQVGTHG